MSTTPDSSGRKKGSWLKKLLIALAVLVVLLVGAFFYLTSASFVKSVVLPKAGAALNAKITVDDANVKPFSQVHLTKLRVQTTGTEPLLTADEVRLRYSLMDIIRGNINVDEVTLNSPVINYIIEPDGSSNLDPILNSGSKETKEEPKSGEPTKLNVQNLSINNATVRQIQKNKDGSVNRTEAQNLKVTLDRLGNGQTGKLAISGNVTVDQNQGGTNSVLQAGLAGGYDIGLTQDLLPESVKGSLKLDVTGARGGFADAAGLNLSLDADLTMKEIRDLGLKFSKNSQALGQLRVSGPMDLEKQEGNLRIELLNLDRNLLNLAMAGSGMDFRDSKFNSTNQVTISQNATFFSATGVLAGQQVSVAQPESVTPELSLNLDYQVNVNLADQTAVLQKLNLLAGRNSQPLISATLDRQMNLSWGQTVKGYKDASLHLVVTNLNLAEWKAFTGTNISSGVVNMAAAIASQQDGKLLNLDVTGAVANLTAQSGTNRLENAAVTFAAKGAVEEMKAVNITQYKLSLAQGNTPLLQANGAARYAMDSEEIAAQLTAEARLPRLLALSPVAGLNLSAGAAKISASVTDNKGKRTATGTVDLEQLTGVYDAYNLDNFQVALEFNTAMEGSAVDIQRAAATFSQGFNAGGSVDLKGKYNLDKNAGQIEYTIVNLNENTLRPFLAPSLGENKLVSIAVNGTGTASVDPEGGNAIKTEIKLANWRVQDPAGKLPQEPLSVDLKVDAGMKEQLLALRDLTVQLTPNQRAKNALQITGKIDMRTNNPAPGNITISSESFDVTPYYDIFAGTPPTNTAAVSTPASPAVATATPEGPEQEPEPMNLPFEQFTTELKIGRLFLRDVAISNWTATVAIRTNNVVINPFQMTLNGGAVQFNGNVNVGVPGYRYDIRFGAENVPLEPLANTFSTENAGLAGNLIANAQIRGAGTTGASLRKNLGGAATLNLTNLDYQIVSPKVKRILTPISLVLNTPELLNTPINWMAAQLEIGNGAVNVQKFGVQSEAFLAESQGTIVLQDVLTNSTLNLPVDLSLRRSLAEKARMLPANTPADAKYAKLPRFVTIKGTVGAPETDINKLALASQALTTAGQIVGDEKAKEILGNLGNVGGILSGSKGTNQTSTNASSSIGNLIGGLLGGGNNAGTNNANGEAVTNAPAPGANNSSTLGNVLGGLFGNANSQVDTNTANTATNAPANNSTNKPSQLNALDLFRLLPGQKK